MFSLFLSFLFSFLSLYEAAIISPDLKDDQIVGVPNETAVGNTDLNPPLGLYSLMEESEGSERLTSSALYQSESDVAFDSVNPETENGVLVENNHSNEGDIINIEFNEADELSNIVEEELRRECQDDEQNEGVSHDDSNLKDGSPVNSPEEEW